MAYPHTLQGTGKRFGTFWTSKCSHFESSNFFAPPDTTQYLERLTASKDYMIIRSKGGKPHFSLEQSVNSVPLPSTERAQLALLQILLAITGLGRHESNVCPSVSVRLSHPVTVMICLSACCQRLPFHCTQVSVSNWNVLALKTDHCPTWLIYDYVSWCIEWNLIYNLAVLI